MTKDTAKIIEELRLCPDFKTFYDENKDYVLTGQHPNCRLARGRLGRVVKNAPPSIPVTATKPTKNWRPHCNCPQE